MAIERYDRGWDAWLPWRRLVDEGLWGWLFGPPARLAAGYPAVDVIERPDEVVVQAELPGVDPDQIAVEVLDHELRLRGEVRREAQWEQEGIHRAERRFGAFMRTVALPADVDPDQARASYRQGILEVHLPKKAGARRRVPVERDGG